VGEVSFWVGDRALKTLGDLSTGGSRLRELLHRGEGVAPKAAEDWAEAICSEWRARRVENVEWRCEEREQRAKEA
jgi:hypothetical protein